MLAKSYSNIRVRKSKEAAEGSSPTWVLWCRLWRRL